MSTKILSIIVFALCAASCSSAPDLNISAKTEDGFVYVRNNESTAQSNCRAQINGDYFLQHQDLPASGVLQMPSSSFINSDSERFNPITHKITSVSLSCGKRFADVEF